MGQHPRGHLDAGRELGQAADEKELREVDDPDGLALRLYPGDRPRVHDVVAIGNPDLYAGLFSGDAPLQFAEPTEEVALIGAGTTHHMAWRAADDAQTGNTARIIIQRLCETPNMSAIDPASKRRSTM